MIELVATVCGIVALSVATFCVAPRFEPRLTPRGRRPR